MKICLEVRLQFTTLDAFQDVPTGPLTDWGHRTNYQRDISRGVPSVLPEVSLFEKLLFFLRVTRIYISGNMHGPSSGSQ